MWNRVVMLGVVMLGVAMNAGCEELKMGNLSPSEAFADKRVAALVNAIGREDLAAIDDALKAGANINVADAYTNTPLHWALTKKGVKVSTIEHLLKNGANPAQADKDGDSPLWLLANSNRPDLLEAMLRHGANPNTQKGSSSLLGEATLFQWEENIKVLLKYGANVNAVDQFNQGIVCGKAAAVGRFDLVVRYLELGLNVDLIRCARGLGGRVVPADSPQNQWREKAFALMKEKGVTFPLPPRLPMPPPRS